MKISSIKTHSITTGESILDILEQYLPPIKENTIVAITSKIISTIQGRVISSKDVSDKYELYRTEADAYIIDEYPNSNATCLTIKDSRLIPFSGVDESNSNGSFILYPKDITHVASQIWQYLRMRDSVENLGIIITDSNITPLRRGVTGIAIAWFGFEPIYNYVGKKDVFGRVLKMTEVNNIDALASGAVFVMGEGDESTPIAVINDAPRIKFWEGVNIDLDNASIDKVAISIDEDFYSPILSSVKWQWNKI